MMGGADNLSVGYTPHSYYFGCAIRKKDGLWEAHGANGMTGYVVSFKAPTLKQLKAEIKAYWVSDAARWKKAYERVS